MNETAVKPVKTKKKDLTRGPVFKSLLLFTMPILLSHLLQQLYSTADTVMVGQFVSKEALAAVGSTSPVTLLILNLFSGFAVGANVVCAQYFGAKDEARLRRAMETSLISAAAAGIVLQIIGISCAGIFLGWMGCPDDVIGLAALYMRVRFISIPCSLLYNCGAGILRAHGDTKRPMRILMISGLINVVFNFLFVAVLPFGVAGVAAATAVSQTFSCVVTMIILFRPHGEFRLKLREMRFSGTIMKKVAVVGIPAGLNSITFNFANTLLQRKINTFGSSIMAGNSAANSLNAYIYISFTVFAIAAASFVGQNYGAKEYRRIDRGVWASLIYGVVFSLFLGLLINRFPEFFVGLFSKDPAMVDFALAKLRIVGILYFLMAPGEILTFALRGMGESLRPFLINSFCICGVRILWIYLIFPLVPTPEFLYWCYAVSWVFSDVAMAICFFIIRKRKYKDPLPEPEPAEQSS